MFSFWWLFDRKIQSNLFLDKAMIGLVFWHFCYAGFSPTQLWRVWKRKKNLKQSWMLAFWKKIQNLGHLFIYAFSSIVYSSVSSHFSLSSPPPFFSSCFLTPSIDCIILLSSCPFLYHISLCPFPSASISASNSHKLSELVVCFSVVMLYIAWKKRTSQKIHKFCPVLSS